MENNQRSTNSDQQNGSNQQNNESLNTASGLRDQSQREQDSAGSGRSYDYGTEGSSEEDMNQNLGRNSNQQDVTNPITPGSDTMPGHSDSRAGMGSGQSTKQNIAGSDLDGQAS